MNNLVTIDGDELTCNAISDLYQGAMDCLVQSERHLVLFQVPIDKEELLRGNITILKRSGIKILVSMQTYIQGQGRSSLALLNDRLVYSWLPKRGELVLVFGVEPHVSFIALPLSFSESKSDFRRRL